MTTKAHYERITVDDVRVGDFIARTRNARFERVNRISEGPVARTLYGRHPSQKLIGYNADGSARWAIGSMIDYIIMRPRRTAKLWREDPIAREVRLEEAQAEDEMEAQAVRGISAPEF